MKSFIPNFFTLTNLLFGTVGVVTVLGLPFDDFQICPTTLGAFCICLGCVCDFLDGFFARLLGSTSKIGKNLDALADLVTFGLLPSFILLQFLNHALDEMPNYYALDKLPLGLVPMSMPCFTAYRLARFNSIQSGDDDCFVGLSSTACGMLVAAICICVEFSDCFWLKTLLVRHETILILTTSLAVLMVSRIKFLSYKFSSLAWQKNQMRYITLLLYICSILVLKIDGLLLSFAIYLLSPISFLFTRSKRKL